MHRSILLLLLSVHVAAFSASAAGVRVQFDPSKPEVGPFPTDYLTAPATNTRTARQVRMPAPADCTASPNNCQEAWLASNLDGFHPQGRIRVRFSGAINPATIGNGITLIARDNLADDEPGVHKTNDVIRLNQIIFDPATNTAYGKPDGPMDQHRRYLLVVTDAVKDAAGDAVEVDPAYTACAADAAADDYCKSLNAAVKAVSVTGRIVAASLYSTMSVTSWLEKAREQIRGFPTDITNLGYFPLKDVNAAIWQLEAIPGAPLTDIQLPVDLVRGGIGGIGLGSYVSPNYLGVDRVIAPVASLDNLPADIQGADVHYTAYLPVVEKPVGGYPVVIYGHGMGDSRFGGPGLVGSTLGAKGFATIAINAIGHGFGPNGKFLFNTTSGAVEVPAPGRGADVNGDGFIDSSEGCAAVVSAPFGLRDCLRQTTVDLMQLARIIRAGLDVDGDGVPDLNPQQIYYVGQSLGSLYGTMFLAVDTIVQAGALNSGGGSVVDIQRWSLAFHPVSVQSLSLRRPSLLNKGSDYDENYVTRDQAPKVQNVTGASEIQNAFEMQEWIQAEGDPAVYAAHLKLSPLAGMSPKTVLWQFAIGDQVIPNPTASTLVRNSGMMDTTWIYRHDRARFFGLPANPHEYMTGYIGIEPTFNFFALPIARATQQQIAVYFQTGEIPDPNVFEAVGSTFGPIFEKPTALPEDLNYLEP